MNQASGVMFATVLATAAIAQAQPAPDVPPTGGGSASAEASAATPADPYARMPPRQPPRPPDPPVDSPEVLRIPTGWLLPAAVIYSRTSVDTGGGVSSDQRVGLGDVAEFGVATTDQVRERLTPDAKAEQIQPYVTASFRMGVAENRLFDNQPGLTLGFRKSFERNHGGFKSRIAELTLVASKHLGERAAVHVGGALWDASLTPTTTTADGAPPTEVTLHGHGSKNQLRVFGGLEARPLPKSAILIDLSWAPEFCYACVDDGDTINRIRLRPELAWGVRYEVASFMHLESGVRVPDIGNFNLLDAQIFGQVTFTTFALKHAVDDLR
jgi:hypothetical protein